MLSIIRSSNGRSRSKPKSCSSIDWLVTRVTRYLLTMFASGLAMQIIVTLIELPHSYSARKL